MKIYTDGGCDNMNTKKGAYGFYIPSLNVKYQGNDNNTTNNKMELTAIKKALEYCLEKKIEDVEIISDSEYCINSLTIWMKNRIISKDMFGDMKLYKTNKNGKPTIEVENGNLLINILNLMKKLKVSYKWVRGHSGIEGNEIANLLAENY